MAKFGFIGIGNMGGALASAVAKSVNKEDIMLSDCNEEKLNALALSLGIQKSTNEEIANNADYIFLGLKPQVLPTVSKSLSGYFGGRKSRFIIVSMAAGVSIEKLSALLGDYPIIRIMPNTPASIGEGAVLYDCSSSVTEDEKDQFLSAMANAGKLIALKENLIDAGCAISGCGPAFVDMFIEALADGGVYCGLPRDIAYLLASQTLKGSAALMQQSGKNPSVLKDEVCSPGGTTIEGVKELEKHGFRGAVINAVIASYKKNFNIG